MRIIHQPNLSVPATGVESGSPSVDSERVEALENIAKSILQKLQAIEERIEALEQTPKNSPAPSIPMPAETPAAASAAAPAEMPVSLNVDAVKKGLLTKMWKYLNDQAAA